MQFDQRATGQLVAHSVKNRVTDAVFTNDFVGKAQYSLFQRRELITRLPILERGVLSRADANTFPNAFMRNHLIVGLAQNAGPGYRQLS